MIVDSCYSGIDFSKGNQNLFEDFEANLDLMISEGWTLAASCKGDEMSYLFPEKDVSVFTYYLVEAFNILPETLNLNELSIDQIYDYTSKKVAKWAFENHKSQTPTLKSERVGTLKFKVNLDTDYTIDTTLASVGDKVIIESTKIILNTSKHFPSSTTYKDYGFNILGSSYPIIRPNTSGFIGQEEIKTINYTDDERIEKREKFEEKSISTFLGRCLDYVKPSQILCIDSHNYELPFGNLQIENENDYQSSITLEILKKDLNKEINIFLQELDDQQIVQWKRLSYSFDGTFNFDLLTDKLKKEGYKISKFDLYNNKIIANFGEEKDILTISFTNLEGESFIEIQTRNDLPKDFFDILPTQKIFEDFQDTISDNC